MIINVNVKNNAVDYTNQTIDIEKNGCYLVRGHNGSGKSTVLKNIVFTKKFENENCNYFAYAEQDPEKYDIRVCDYLSRLNTSADIKLRDKLLNRFKLDYLKLKTNIQKVSGGELIKLNIIACLIKETSFVFLDEPTNNLDDESVDILKEMISELQNDRVIVIVSHDPRMIIKDCHYITIENNNISVDYTDKNNISSNTLDEVNCKYPYKKIFLRYIKKPAMICTILVLLLYGLVFLCVNHIAFLKFYNDGEIAEKNGSVLVYSVDCVVDELSMKYAKVHSIEIPNEKNRSMIVYNDIPEIYEKYGFDELYIENYIFIDTLYDKLQNGNPLDDPVTVSFPKFVLDNYMEQIDSYFTVRYLIDGRYPKDNSNEIVLSKNLIDKYYKGVEVNDEIVFNEKIYTVVGIHAVDWFIVSYNEDDTEDDSYMYHYRYDTYNDFIKSQTEYKKQHDMLDDYIYRPNILIFKGDSSDEAANMKSLFKDYPANNYRSYSYDNDMAIYYNSRMIAICFGINVAAGIIIGLMINKMNHKRREDLKTESVSFDNYYLCYGRTAHLFSVIEISVLSIIIALFVVSSVNFAKFKFEISTACTGFVITVIILLISQFMNLKKHYD